MTGPKPSLTREWNSCAYHRLSSPQVGWGKKVLSRLHLRGNELILDAGCGTGRLTADLLETLPKGRVVALDLSQNMLRSAQEHLQASFGSQVIFVVADLLHLPFDNSFDGIVSTACFHWVLDHDQLFKELRRALKPGGWIEAQCGGGPNLQKLRNRADNLAATLRFENYFSGFREPWLYQDAERAAGGLSRAGFIDVETSLEAATTVLDGPEQYAEFLRNIIFRRHLEQIPNEDLRSEFIHDLTTRATHDDPPFLLDYWRLNLRGRSA